jgi:ABC-type nitrate/sulfonate/bicarbonate transport system permease component
MKNMEKTDRLGSVGFLHQWWSNRSFWRILSLVIAFGVWEMAGTFGSNIAVPSFSSTVHALLSLLLDGTLPKAYGITLQPLIVGLFLATTTGIGFGIAMGLSRTLEWFTVVVFIALQAAPMAAVIPVITFVYGIGFTAKVVAVFVLATPGIILNSFQGVRNVNVSLIQMSQSFLATRRQQIAKVILPATSNMIIASLRMGLAAAFVGIILAELLITPTGLGDLITYNQSMGEYANMYATICSLIILAALSISLLQWVENNYSSSRKRIKAKGKLSEEQQRIMETEE